MPLIPLFRDGQSVKTPKVLPPGQNRRLNVVMDLNGAAQGFATPKTPYSLADRSGGQAIGQAMTNVSKVMEHLALKKAEARNVRHVAEADAKMQQAYFDYEKWKVKNPDPVGWETEWQGRVAGLHESVFTDDHSPKAREDIQGRLGLFNTTSNITVAKMAMKQEFAMAGDALKAGAESAFASGDIERGEQYVSDWVRGGYGLGSTGAEIVRDAKRIDKGKRRDSDMTRAEAFLAGDMPDVDQAVATIQDSPNFDDDEKKIQIDRLKTNHATEATTRKNRESAKLYGDLNYEAAKGNHLTSDQVDLKVRDGVLSKEDAVPLLEGIKRREAGLPAPSEEFNAFITDRVLAYDPAKDSDGAEFEAIQREASGMGADSLQMQRLLSNLNGVVKRAETSSGKVETNLKKWTFSHINDLQKAGAFGRYKSDTDAALITGLVGVQSKAVAFGLSDSEAKSLAAVSGPERLSMFQEFAKNRYQTEGNKSVAKFDIAAYNTLSEREKELFNLAATGKANEGVLIDPVKEAAAGATAAELQDHVEFWFQEFTKKNNRLPEQKEVMKAVNQITGQHQNSAVWDVFTPVAPQASAEPERYQVEPDGSFIGTASSYGYAGDADNGFNSVGMLRGEQPWYGKHPTVALAPSTAETLGVSLPRKTKDGWDYSNSIVEVEVNGKKTKAIFDETGMYINANSKRKLVDLTPEASAALGLPIKTNAANVKVRKAS